MIKLVGAALILLASTIFGFVRARQFAERPKQIRQLVHALGRLSTEISYGSTPLPEALRKLAQICGRPLDSLFALAAERLTHDKSVTVREAWTEAIDHISGQTSMKAPELEVLRQLGTTLGISDREDQLKHLALASSQLMQEEVEAREEQSRYEKLSRSLGVLGGALIVVLIF